MSKSAPQSPRWTSAAWSVLPVLIGRDQDIAALEQTVQQRRLVTLWGPGGSGKSCLAQHVAQHLRDSFADGVRFVACADLHDPDLLVPHVATTLGVKVPDEHRPIDALIEWLQARHLLLVVDNCEHLLTACTSLVDELLLTCSHLHVLVTSRELLNLPTEQAYPVQPLSLPPPERFPGEKNGLDVSKVETYGAIQLFVQRAQVAQPDFALTSENAALIVRICRLVDGLPLAIELAAARVRMLALEQLANRLETSPAILSSANRLAPARQQTLQATISWSYQLLAPAEQQLFRRLALVAGSFDLSLVEALQEHGADLRGDVVDLLAHLIDKSLVCVVGLDGTARYRLLDTLQHYGQEQLQQSGETEITYGRYQEWVCHLVEDAEAELMGPRQGAWLDRLEAEIEHIRAVIRWLLQNGEVAPVVQISSALVTFCGYRAYTREVIQWLEKALATAGAIEPALETTAMFALGVLSIRRHRADPKGGHLTQAQEYLTKAQEGHTRIENQAGMAGALCQLGYVHYWQADYPAARTCLEAGLAIAPRETLNLRADLLHRLGSTVFQLGALHEAAPYYRQSLALRRQTADVGGVALTLACLGGLLAMLGDYDQAGEYLRESLRHFEDLGDHNGYLLALLNLHDVALGLGDPAITRDYLAFALSSVWADVEIGLLSGLFEQLARMALLQGQPVQAARLFGIGAGLCCVPPDQPPDAVLLQLQQAQGASADVERYTAAWREGQMMGLDDAFAVALQTASAAEVNELQISDQANATPGVAVETSLRSTIVKNHATVNAIAPLRIEAFGGGTVYREPGIEEVTWHYSSARELLFYLLDVPHRTKEQICLALWPDAAKEQAGIHMRVTFYQLRKTLADAAWVPFTPAGYAFNRSLPYRYDVEQFQALIAQADTLQEAYSVMHAEGADDPSTELLAQACGLYRGTYLADFAPHEWIVQRQTELQRQYLHALSRLGASYERQGDNQQALAWYQRLTACDPYDEQAHAAILRCYVRLGRRSKALRYYRDLQHFLRNELGVTPDPHITAFVRSLLSQMGAAS